MAISNKEDDLREAARLALLESIAGAAAKTSSYTALNALAEAYAWVVMPGQPHGASLPGKS